jgi:kynurenine formamidase
MTTNPIVTASELRRFLLHTSTSTATHADLPMHVI